MFVEKKKLNNILMKDDVTLVEQTQRDILKYISQNGNAAKLPKEQDFVELLGVSRVVVREALSRLRAVGIIETKRKKGTTVVVPEVFGVLKSIVDSGLLDKDTLRDLYQLRLMLEIGMADFIYMNKTPQQMEAYRQFAQCINCGCCYAACPQYKINKDFIGPAALTLLYRYNIDNRDGGQAQRMPFLNAEEGVWSCTFVGYCSEVCPKHVDPSSAIQLGKKMSATDYVIRMFKPE